LQANSFLKAFKSFLGSYSEGTPWRVVIVFRPLRCWIRMWIALARKEVKRVRVSKCSRVELTCAAFVYSSSLQRQLEAFQHCLHRVESTRALPTGETAPFLATSLLPYLVVLN
jgi:hypothetical protein